MTSDAEKLARKHYEESLRDMYGADDLAKAHLWGDEGGQPDESDGTKPYKFGADQEGEKGLDIPFRRPIGQYAEHDYKMIDGILCTPSGYPALAAYGLMAAPSGDHSKWGTLGYGIADRGWEPYVQRHIVPVMEHTNVRRPDFVLNGTPGPVINGQMAWQTPYDCYTNPEWWGSSANLVASIVPDTWGAWRRAIPNDIPFIQYCGRINSLGLMEMGDRAAAKLFREVLDFYIEDVGCDALAIDASSIIGGCNPSNIPAYGWLSDHDDRPIVQAAVDVLRHPTKYGLRRAYTEAFPASSSPHVRTGNRLLGGVPAMSLSHNLHNSSLYSDNPQFAPAHEHTVMCLGRAFRRGVRYRYAPTARGAANARLDYSKGVKEFAIALSEWPSIAPHLPLRRWTTSSMPCRDC